MNTKLVGKTIKHTWTEGPFAGAGYETTLTSEHALSWKAVAGQPKGMSDSEEYMRTDIAPGVVQLSWKESTVTTGFTVVLTLNFDTKKIYGVIGDKDKNYVLAGSFTVEDMKGVK